MGHYTRHPTLDRTNRHDSPRLPRHTQNRGGPSCHTKTDVECKSTVDRGDDDAKPDMREYADRARTSNMIVAVNTRRRVTEVYQNAEKRTAWTVATTTRSQTPSETINSVDTEDKHSAQRRLEPQMSSRSVVVDDTTMTAHRARAHALA